jgi:hypothetical protein
MKSALVKWQQVLSDIRVRIPLLALLLALVLVMDWCPLMAGEQVGGKEPPRTFAQTIAVALPELEGPITIGIFSPDGELVRLLYRDAAVESIPAGLNGLIMAWDGKDDAGLPVSPGTYRVRGLVHGPITFSVRPSVDPSSKIFSSLSPYYCLEAQVPEEPLSSPLLSDPSLPFYPPITDRNHLTIPAAKDELQEVRPWLRIEARIKNPSVMITAEGLPLAECSLPIGTSPSLSPRSSSDKNDRLKPRSVSLHEGPMPGTAQLSLRYAGGTESYFITGIDKIVPLEAGTLVIPPAAFQSTPVGEESWH